MDYLLITYLAYLIITIALTFWVGKTLFVNGKIFLMDIFSKNELLVDSINKLLLIGFYLINFGYVLIHLKLRSTIDSATKSVEVLSEKVGLIVIILGIIHFVNIFILVIMKSKSRKAHRYESVSVETIPTVVTEASNSK